MIEWVANLRTGWESAGSDQWVMLDLIWQSTLVGVAGLIVARCCIRYPAARAWVLLIALTGSLFLPVSCQFARHMGWHNPLGFLVSTGTSEKREVSTQPTGQAPVQNNRIINHSDLNKSQITAPVRDLNSTHQTMSQTMDRHLGEGATSSGRGPSKHRKFAINTYTSAFDKLFTVLGIVWVAISFILFLRLAVSYLRLRRLIRRASLCCEPKVMNQVRRVARQLSLRHAPTVVVSDEINAPMIFAFFRSTLMVPKDRMCLRDGRQWQAVLTHELAHIRRRDGWARLWVQVISACLPLLPTTWWMRRSFFVGCEEACDDWAVALGGDPVELASALTAWVRDERPARDSALAVGVSSTRSRIVRLLAMRDRPTATLTRRTRIACVLAAILLCSGVVVAQLPVSENSEEGSAVVDEPADQDVRQNPTEQNTRRTTVKEQAAGKNVDERSMTVMGICIDENDRPLAGVGIRLFSLDYPQADGQVLKLEPQQQAITNSNLDGRFRIDVDIEKTDVSWVVVAQQQDKATNVQWIQRELAEQTLKLQLKTAATLRGRVTDEMGQPVPNTLVSADQSGLLIPGIRAAYTNADGLYRIDDVESFDDSNGKWRRIDGSTMRLTGRSGHVLHPEYARSFFRYTKVPSMLDVTLKRPAVVEGQIVFKENGLPAAGAQVEVYEVLPDDLSDPHVAADYWTRARTDAMGNYRVGNLPPGDYHIWVSMDGRPNLFRNKVRLDEGTNRHDFECGEGGVVTGRWIDVTTGKPIRLAEGERLQIGTCNKDGVFLQGMAFANAQPDGSFTLRVQPGRNYFGVYYGEKWRGVNTDRLLRQGVVVKEGETVELELRVRPHNPEHDRPPKPLSGDATQDLVEQAAIAAIKQLGGWVETEVIQGKQHVVEVNMVYHENELMGREENRLICDESLAYMSKFPQLKRLMLWHEQATDRGLSQLRENHKLESIDIWHASEVTDAGVAHLAQLQNLTSVHISEGALTDQALQHLSQLPKLKRLSVQGNRFTNRGLEHLGEMTQLKELFLGSGQNAIDDEGLQHLAKLTSLETLVLPNSGITNAGLKHLRSLKRLELIWLSGPGVSDDGLKALRRELPLLE